MTSSTAIMLWLVLSTAAAYNYQRVTKCPKFKGDPNFSTSTVTVVSRKIHATTSTEDVATDRCVSIKKGSFYVTGYDSSFSILKFSSIFDVGSGTYTETGPDGNTYKVIVIKSFPSCCSRMDLLLLCSDTVGSNANPPLVNIHADFGAHINDICMDAAKRYAEAYLATNITFNVLPNSDCSSLDDFCPN